MVVFRQGRRWIPAVAPTPPAAVSAGFRRGGITPEHREGRAAHGNVGRLRSGPAPAGRGSAIRTTIKPGRGPFRQQGATHLSNR